MKKNIFRMPLSKNLIKRNSKSAFTILELLITMILVSALTAPILNTFQVSERLGERSRKSFVAQNLAREMMAEISSKSFNDPDNADTDNVLLKPGRYHEEYNPAAALIQNGTGENGLPYLTNETILNRNKYFDDIDDYADYNTDETLLPTLASGKEYLVNGQNLYENYRIKVSVTNDTSKIMNEKSILDDGIIPGTMLTGIAATTDSKYILSLNGDEKSVSVINARTNKEIDMNPATADTDRIKIENSGIPSKILLGASQDRFFVLNKAENTKIESTSSVSIIDMNVYNASEYSFHKVHNIVSNGLKSNSITAVTADKKSRIFAGTVKGGLVRSADNGISWQLMNIKLDSGDIEDTITCLATVNYGYGMGNDITYAGSARGLWYTENGGDSWKKIQTITNVSAVAVKPNGYVAVGLSTGKFYGFKKFAINNEVPFHSAIAGPSSKAVSSIVIDENYNLIIAVDDKIYYSSNFFDFDTYSGAVSALFSQYGSVPSGHGASALYIDKSASYPSAFKKITNLTPGSVPAITFAPSIHVNETGIHLFYLSDAGSGSGSSIGIPQLYYISSADYGKSWSGARKISSLNKNSEPAWAHSEAIDEHGVIHASWFSKINNCWKLCYQRGDNFGQSWLTSEILLSGDTSGVTINGLKFADASDSNWFLNGAGRHQNICVSPLNRVYIAFSGDENDRFHHLIYSYDGGTGWNTRAVVKIAKPADRAGEVVESINYITPENQILWVLKSSGKRRTMLTDSDGNVLDGRISGFDADSVSESAPLVMNENLTYLYFYSSANKLSQFYDNFPYKQNAGANYHYQPYIDSIFQSVWLKNNIYTFYKAQNKIFALKSSNGGIDAQTPIFICDYAPNSSGAAAAFGNDVYFITKTADLSPGSTFQLCMFSNETLFGGGRELCFTSDLKDFSISSYGNLYQNCGFTINCFHGDDNGSILCGTSDGLFILNARGADTAVKIASDSGDVYNTYNSLLKTDIIGGRQQNWAKYFSGIKITSVCAEKGGTYLIGTADRGMFRSVDYGASWENISAVIGDIVDISIVGSGQAAELNKINIFSKRYGLNASQNIMEYIVSVYNLSNNKIESTSVISDNYESIGSAAAAFDNMKFFYFDKTDKNIYSQKHNRLNKNIITAAGSGYLLTGLNTALNDTLEIISSGKYWLDKENPCFFSTPAGLNCNFRQDPSKYLIGNLTLKTGNNYRQVNQYYKGPAIGQGEISYQISADNYADSNGYLTVTTSVTPAKEKINLLNKINHISNLIAAPDNDTLYAVDNTANKVYAISNINNPAAVAVREYSKNINNPADVIFSPKNSAGQFKSYIVCKKNVVDLEGNKILNETRNFDIQAAIVNDGGDLFFVDKITRKIFKCNKASEKTVYVTVSDNDVRMAGSMPPVTIAKKFYQWRSGDFKSYHLAGGQKPNRDYFKYEFIYTSKEYPNGILTGASVKWQPKKTGFSDVLNVYVADSILDIKGSLEIFPGTIVKFATADKNLNIDDFSGKANSCLKVAAGGRLVISGGLNDSEKVIFTSIDDNSLAPSVYNAPDGVFKTASGYPNTQVLKGPLPGDWGCSDGASKSYGGLLLQTQADITGLDAYYGLFYSGSLYPGNIKLKNYDLNIGVGGLLNEWRRTNVFVVNDDFEVPAGASLHVKPGTIIKFDNLKKIKINGNTAQCPGPALIFDGSYSKKIFMDSVLTQNLSGEYKTPAKNESGYWGFIESLKTTEIGVFKNVVIGNANLMNLNESSLEFNNCRFNLASPGVFKAELSRRDCAVFTYCEFNLNRGSILSRQNSNNEFINCDFKYKPYLNGNNSDYGIKSSAGAALIIKNNKFEINAPDISSDLSATADSNVNNGSNICSDSIIRVENNFFNNLSVNSAASCEINLSGKNASLVWPEIYGNNFENSKLPVYIDGFETTAVIIKNRFYNNYFKSCAKLASTKVPAKGSGPGEFNITGNLTVDQFDNIYIIDGGNNTLNKYTPGGRLIMQIGGSGSANGKFNGLYDAAVNETGEIYLTDKNNFRVQKFDKSGNFILAFGINGDTPGKFKSPAGIKVLTTPTAEVIFVTDNIRHKLMKFKPAGEFVEEIGKLGTALEQFNTPLGLAVSRDNKYVYLADSANNRIQKVKALLDTVEVERFDITALTGTEADRGEYIKLKVRALDKDGNLMTGYNKAGAVNIDYVPGVVRWAGNGITDNSYDSSDNGARFDASAFSNGEAVIYVVSMKAYAARRVTIIDAVNPEMKGTIDLTWGDGAEHSLKCIGSSSYVKLPNFLLPQKVTVETWFKTNECGTIFSIANSDCPNIPGHWVPVLYVGTDGNLYGKFWDFKGQAGAFIVKSPSIVNDLIWHHCAITYDGSMYRLYVDGIMVSSLAGTIEQYDMNYLYIGTGYTDICWDPSNRSWFYFNGLIDEVKIWNFALNADQIKQSMNAVSAGNESGLIGYYKFNEETGCNPADKCLNTGHIGNGILINSGHSNDFK